MSGKAVFRVAKIVALAAAFCVSVTTLRAEDDPLKLLIGHWSARVKTLQPKMQEITYDETYEWVLEGKFLKGQTTNKSDKTQDISFGTYDANLQGYPFWIFSSTGTYIYLAPATWDATTRTLEFRNPPNSDIYYNTSVIFSDKLTRRWTVIVKDWTGRIILEQEGSAVRREN